MLILIGGFIGLLVVIISGFRVIYQFEDGVVFTFGKYTEIKKAGLTWIMPLGIQNLAKVDMRLKTIDVPRQEIITKDNISIMSNAVVYFRIEKSDVSIVKFQNVGYAITQYTQAVLRDVLGNQELDVILSERVKIGAQIQEVVEQETNTWGIVVENIKIQEIEIPQELKRAMAKQAEAERERRAMVISADGELQASKTLQAAAEALSKHPMALQLRTLQTIRDISTNASQKIILFMPSDLGGLVKGIVDNK